MKRFLIQTKEGMMQWKFAIFLAFCFATVPAISCYIGLTDTFTSSSWETLGTFERNRIYLLVISCALSNVMAFFNRTAGNVRDDIAAKKEGDTTLLIKQTLPPKID